MENNIQNVSVTILFQDSTLNYYEQFKYQLYHINWPVDGILIMKCSGVHYDKSRYSGRCYQWTLE